MWTLKREKKWTRLHIYGFCCGLSHRAGIRIAGRWADSSVPTDRFEFYKLIHKPVYVVHNTCVSFLKWMFRKVFEIVIVIQTPLNTTINIKPSNINYYYYFFFYYGKIFGIGEKIRAIFLLPNGILCNLYGNLKFMYTTAPIIRFL